MAENPAVSIAAIEAVYRLRFHRFLRVAEAICGERELAHDAVQEAFVRAIRARFSFRGDASLDTWLWRAVVNVSRDARRRSVDAAALGDCDEHAAPAVGNEPESTRLISALPERQRLVLFLRYYADLDYRSIADALGISVGTVGATLNQAHAALRRQSQEVR